LSVGFGGARRLTEDDVYNTQVAVSRGLTAIAWSEALPGGETAGAFGRTGRPVDDLRTHVLAGSRSYLVGLAVARGRATALFTEGMDLRARQVTGGGSRLGEPQTISRLTDNLGLRRTDPRLAVSASGRPYAAWPAGDSRIEVARSSLRSGRFRAPERIRAPLGYDQLRLIPTRGDAMLLAYVHHAWHLLAYGE
jgi:hypothetical protein